MNNTPQIRFKGYSDAWVQRRLGDVTEHFEYGLNAAAKDFDGTHKYIRITDIDDNLRHFNEDNLTSPDINFATADSYLLKQGDILFARTGASVGKTYIHKNAESHVYFAGFLIRARISDKHIPEFIYQNTLTKNYSAFIKVMSQRSGQPGVNAQEYASYSLGVPNTEEQKKLGQFFRTLDTAITLSQRKLDGLRRLKAAYLQQMFPQAGERVPRVRFAGFDGEWKETRIGDIFEVTRGQVLAATKVSAEKDDVNAYPVYSSQTKNNGLLGYYVDFLFDTAITWTTDGANAGTVNFREGKFYSTNVNGVLLSKDGFANRCIAEALNMVAWKYVSKVGNPKLMNNIMAEIMISAPPLSEQIVIGNLFKSIDDQLVSQAQKIVQLKRLKAAYLQKMFV